MKRNSYTNIKFNFSINFQTVVLKKIIGIILAKNRLKSVLPMYNQVVL